MMERRSEHVTSEQQAPYHTVRRRGLIAGAAALVAGIVAKQAAEPVAAGGTDHLALIIGEGNTSSLQTALSGNYSPGNNGNQPMFLVHNTSVTGSAMNSLADGFGYGIFATSAGGVGVYGRTGTADNGATSGGVLGQCTNGGNGVAGVAASGGTGVLGTGTGDTGYGVYGKADAGLGVFGNATTTGNGVYGLSSKSNGIVGVTFGTGNIAGIYGTSSSAYGVIGTSTASGYSGLTGTTSTPGVAALGATATVPNAYAAFFTGTTVVNGNFVATGGTKSAAVPLNGEHRLVYCVESPESWFEDFGEAKLVNGKAAITHDPDFAGIVHTDSYHVFLTEYGGHNDLYVDKRTASGFEVHAKSGTPTGMFSWRVVAKRKDIVGERLAKFVMPKIAHPDPDKLPKAELIKPELPKKP